MKKFLAALALLVSAQASAFTIPDSTCLKLGEFGQVVATNKEAGVLEDTQLNVLKDDENENAKVNERVLSYFTSIVSYVYTMELDPKNARQLVYLKCHSGDFQ